jgi:hypothetical protein
MGIAAPARTLENLGAAIADLWSTRANCSCTLRDVDLQGDRLTLLFDDALTDVEASMAFHPAGRAAVRKRLDDGLQELYPSLAQIVEGHLGVPIAECSLELDAATRVVYCIMRLQGIPR